MLQLSATNTKAIREPSYGVPKASLHRGQIPKLSKVAWIT